MPSSSMTETPTPVSPVVPCMTATISSSKTCTLCPRRNNPRKKFRKFFGRGSPSDTENLSNQPTIHNGRPSKGVCFLFMPEPTSHKWYIRPPSSSLVPHFGTFITHFQDILGGQKCFPRDFRDQFTKFPNISCNRGTFFQKCGENFSGGQGLRPPSAPRGWVCFSSLFRSLAWACFRPPVGLPASLPAACPIGKIAK